MHYHWKDSTLICNDYKVLTTWSKKKHPYIKSWSNIDIEKDDKPFIFNMAVFKVIILAEWFTCLRDTLNVRNALCITGLQNTLKNLWWQSSAKNYVFSSDMYVTDGIFTLTCYFFSHFLSVDITSDWKKTSNVFKSK